MGTSHNHLDWPRLSYREQFKEGDEEAGRGNDGKTTSKSGLALNGIYGIDKIGIYYCCCCYDYNHHHHHHCCCCCCSYLLQIMLEAGCLEWALIISVVLRDSLAVIRTVNTASMTDTPLDMVARMREGLSYLELWADTEW